MAFIAVECLPTVKLTIICLIIKSWIIFFLNIFGHCMKTCKEKRDFYYEHAYIQYVLITKIPINHTVINLSTNQILLQYSTSTFVVGFSCSF
jgi:hypothetical protein